MFDLRRTKARGNTLVKARRYRSQKRLQWYAANPSQDRAGAILAAQDQEEPGGAD
jgi:hypothetical protein